jgi:hypothetical protein
MSETDPPALATTPALEGWRMRARVGLADLMTWVLGVGVGASVYRGVKPGSWLGPPVDVDRFLGLGTAILAIFFGIGLLRQAVVRAWRRRAGGEAWLRVSDAWRLAVVALLGSFLAFEVDLLRDDPGKVVPEYSLEAGRRLVPLCATLAMAGVLAGLVPGRARGRPRRLAWLSVAWAWSAAVVIAATQVFLPYLVLVALEAVSNAMSRLDAAQRAGPGLQGRIGRAGLEAIPALACGLLLGLLISREFRRPAPPAGVTDTAWRGPLALLAAGAAMAAAAAWLLSATIPMIHPRLAEGLWMAIAPRDAAVIVLGFAGLAIGPSARAADRSVPSEAAGDEGRRRASSLRILLKTAFALILLDVIVAHGQNIAGFVVRSQAPRAVAVDVSVLDVIVLRGLYIARSVVGSPTWHTGWVEDAVAWFRSLFPSVLGQPWTFFRSPQWLALSLALAWVSWRVACLLVSPIGTGPTPIDACLEDSSRAGRFAIRWLALTVLMVASLPVLFVAGLVAFHGFLRVFG